MSAVISLPKPIEVNFNIMSSRERENGGRSKIVLGVERMNGGQAYERRA